MKLSHFLIGCLGLLPSLVFADCGTLPLTGRWNNTFGQDFQIVMDDACSSMTFQRVPKKEDSPSGFLLGGIKVRIQPEGDAKFDKMGLTVQSGLQGLPPDVRNHLNVFMKTGMIKVEHIRGKTRGEQDSLRITTTNHVVLPREFTGTRTQTGVFKIVAKLFPTNFYMNEIGRAQAIHGLTFQTESLELVGIVNGDGTEIAEEMPILYGANLVLKLFKSSLSARLLRNP